MKKNFIFVVFIFASVTFSFAAQWSVSNSTQNPGQFSSISDAVAAVASGDTLLIHPTPTSYGSFTLNKKLVIIGGGFNTQKINANYSQFGVITIVPASSGSKFFGLRIHQVNASGAGAYDSLQFENCYVSSYILFLSSEYPTNFLARNCVLDDVHLSNIVNSSATFLNCIFEGTGPRDNSGDLVVSQCLFQGTSHLTGVSGAIIQECIFYDGSFGSVSTSTFNNCLSYNVTNNTLPPGSNIGSNNLSGVDPMFVNNPIDAAYSFTNRDFHLQAGSPALTGGINGGQIGLYGDGSTFSNSGEPLNSAIIRSFTITNAAVPVNGNLDIDVTITKPLED